MHIFSWLILRLFNLIWNFFLSHAFWPPFATSFIPFGFIFFLNSVPSYFRLLKYHLLRGQVKVQVGHFLSNVALCAWQHLASHSKLAGVQGEESGLSCHQKITVSAHQSPDHHYHSYFPVPKGINMTAPPNHPDPIYAGFSRPFERNPTTRVATQHHRGGESVDPTEISTSLQSLDSLIRTVYCSNSTYHSLHWVGELLGEGKQEMTALQRT